MIDEPSSTYHIHLRGRVQGLGFRPYVYRLAKAHQLSGWVNNGLDGVHICINARSEQAEAFYSDLWAKAPALARITEGKLELAPPQFFDTFSIVHSDTGGQADLLLTPDLALCPDCRAEISDPGTRRFRYAFTTCTYCGPRYAIVHSLPYDRKRTSMEAFTMCPACALEYEDVEDRRYYSQTNSCAVCGPTLTGYDAASQQYYEQERALAQACLALQAGQVVAVKGIGGYLLLCDATRAEVVASLRARKHRPSKPFAVLYPNSDLLQADLYTSELELAALHSPEAPIVLLRPKPKLASGLAVAQLAPGLNQIGAMLPYAPLLALLAADVGLPLVATSANLSHAPVIFEEAEAMEKLAGTVADYLLSHNRLIVMPQDDSVLRLSPQTQTPIVLRRSRGMAPSWLGRGLHLPPQSIFCAGADLKSTFTFTHQGNVYLSQYLGDLDHFDTQQRYRQVAEHLLALFDQKPTTVVADKHPGYYSSALASELAADWQADLVLVQHHEAHFWAVLAENELLNATQPVLGVIWDGVGYGHDGQIWGGEFFVFDQGRVTRLTHWEYFPVLAADKMAREPRLSALALCAGHLHEADAWLESQFSASHWTFYKQLVARPQPLQTSSMGRLFDAAASLLGLAEVCSYEGEAALRLEQSAAAAPEEEQSFWPLSWPAGSALSSRALLAQLLEDKKAGLSQERLAARFHYSLVESIRLVASQSGITQLACSGGVWQNAFLVDALKKRLGTDHALFFHKELSPNDECVSFGQLVAYLHKN